MVLSIVASEFMMYFILNWPNLGHLWPSWNKLLQNSIKQSLLWQKLRGILCVARAFLEARITGFRASARTLTSWDGWWYVWLFTCLMSYDVPKRGCYSFSLTPAAHDSSPAYLHISQLILCFERDETIAPSTIFTTNYGDWSYRFTAT